MMQQSANNLLTIDNLHIAFRQGKQLNQVVNGISLSIKSKEIVALVGESGSGKSITALSILKLLPEYQVVYPQGDIQFMGQSLLNSDEKAMRAIRGNQISMIFQDPMMSLNPLHTIEKQLYEVLSLHRGMCKQVARTEIIEYLNRVGVSNAKNRLNAYPHQLSGGERQRVMIAMAILTNPKLLIADEPTTALDVSVQAQIIQLLKDLRHELGMSLLFITHNLGLVKKLADRVAVMYQGHIVEQSNRHRLFLKPEHDYTKSLLNSEPTGEPVPLQSNTTVLLNVKHLNADVVTKKRFLSNVTKRLVDNSSFVIHHGETVGIVGESGSGKSTTALAILRLIKSSGDIIFQGKQLQDLSHNKLLPFRHKIQVVFQDPYSSLNPRFTVEQIISEGLYIHKKLNNEQISELVIKMMKEVGLDPAFRDRYPNEFSGGQRQRIAIARALILQPKLLILDEPTSSLDKTIQNQIIELLKSLQKKYQLSYLFISHDLALVHTLCHYILVMKEGKIVEQGSRNELFNRPQNVYTQSLLSFTEKIKSKPTIQTVQSKKKSVGTNWNDALLMRRDQ